MILTIGVPDYSYRAMREIAGAHIRGRKAGHDIPLILIDADAMADMHKTLPNLRGMPRYAAFDIKRQKIWLHPNPDGEYELDIDRGDAPAEKSTETLSLPKKG